jgi:hypothetical protein
MGAGTGKPAQPGVTLTTSTTKPDEPTQQTCANLRLTWFILEAPFPD